MGLSEVVLRGRWSVADRVAGEVRRLPFEVGAGVAAVRVELAYDRDSGGVLDLGCWGPGGFRGWSGGARESFTVAADWATPGYLPGEPEPGLWHVLLRLHRVPPQGVAYTLRVVTTGRRPVPPAQAAPPVPPERPPRTPLPAVDGMRWLAGDFHAHTVHSDGALTVSELAALAVTRGLDFLAVTDHNTVSHHAELAAVGARYGITLVPGQEVTTDLGHANVFGDTGWVDFREPPDTWGAQIERRGGVLSVNHPVATDCSWRLPLAPRLRSRHVELWHPTWRDRRYGAPLAWALAWRPDVIAIGGSDFHRPGGERPPPGSPTTWVLARDNSVRSVLAGLAAGRTAVHAGGPRAALLLRTGGELLALNAAGTVLVRPDGGRQVVAGERESLPAPPPGPEEPGGPYRLEGPGNEVLALCQ
ncbi:CehA/McbA family metallohydrolase [Streptomyces sp. JH002]|uniref:CehA/McbA family metallohydrolase n=1 Tax=Streptomyces TaxID=1883 RepID=UPI0036A490F2